MNYDIEGYILVEGQSSYTSVSAVCGGGAYILETTGIMSAGRPKNVVTESYADSAGLRSYMPDAVLNGDTEVTLRVLLCSEGTGDMYSKHDALTAAFSGRRVWYWDTVRLRKVLLVLDSETLTEESYKGSVPYLSVTYRFRNVNGFSETADACGYRWSGDAVLADHWKRHRNVTFTMMGEDQSPSYSILDAFPGYSTVSEDTFRNMGTGEYMSRLHAFSAYAIASIGAAVPLMRGNIRTIEDGAWENL